MIHKRFITIILGMVLSITWGHAQTLSNNKLRRGLDDFRKQTRKEFEDFRKQAMNEFISFVRNPWKDFEHTAPVPCTARFTATKRLGISANAAFAGLQHRRRADKRRHSAHGVPLYAVGL